MKAPSIVIAVALLAPCVLADQPHVVVNRRIAKPGTDSAWTMDVAWNGVISFASPTYPSKPLTFFKPEEVRRVFETFTRWSAIAKQTHAEPFNKKIDGDHSFNLETSGRSSLDMLFGDEDVQKFIALLNQYPDIERELRERTAKAAKEADLFK